MRVAPPAWLRRLPPWPLLAGLLGLVLLAELLPGGGDEPAPPPALPAAGTAAQSADAAGWSQTILARPLFNPGRRPANDGQAQDGLPRLSAILIGQSGASAIFAADGQKPLIVHAGGQVAGDAVQSIGPDAVVLLTPTGPLRLTPRFASPAAAASPASSPAPAAAPPGPDAPASGQPATSSTTAGPYDNE